jgi:DNA-binding YbaB/EbfC family protein
MKDMQKMQQQMMKALQEAQELQDSIEKEVVEGSAGGVVTVKATGAMHVAEIKIDKSIVDPEDVESLEDTVLAAVNNALDNARSLQEKRLGGLMGGLGGLGLPGL